MKKNNKEITSKSIYGEVFETKIDQKSGNSYIKVKLPDGQIVGGLITGLEEEPQQADINSIDYKVLKYSQESTAALQAGQTYSSMIGSPENFFLSTEKYGNFISGPTTFTSHPESIRMGGVYRINGLVTSTMASSIVSPIPFLILDLPGEGMLKALKSVLEDFKTILGL